MAIKNDRYTYRVIWSEEDQEHVGLCAEFPSLSWVTDSLDDAFTGIRNLVTDIVTDMANAGESVPEPITTRTYSGKFMVRVPPEVHRNLTIESAETGVSLNRLVSAKLSQ